MSLRSELEQQGSPIRSFLEDRFPATRDITRAVAGAAAGSAPVRPDPMAGKPPWSQIGMAVGYRLGYAIGNQTEQLASYGADKLGGPHPALVAALRAEVKAFGPPDPIARLPHVDEERLARCCWALALYETVFRARPGIATPLQALRASVGVEDLLALPAQPWLDDLAVQTDLAFERLLPSFADVPIAGRRPGAIPSGALHVGGADCDLLIGSTLLEVKTSIRRPERAWVYQLIGYALLDYDDRWQLRDLGFYLPRQGLLITWELQALLATLAGRPVDVAATRAALAQRLGGPARRP